MEESRVLYWGSAGSLGMLRHRGRKTSLPILGRAIRDVTDLAHYKHGDGRAWQYWFLYEWYGPAVDGALQKGEEMNREYV